jgi:hypothetical protein
VGDTHVQVLHPLDASLAQGRQDARATLACANPNCTEARAGIARIVETPALFAFGRFLLNRRGPLAVTSPCEGVTDEQ